MITDKLIIFDWDDTLFPTTWLAANNIKIDSIFDSTLLKYFKEIDKLIYKMFLSIKNYETIIVTNASTLWVSMCMELLPLTKNIEIKVYSSREYYKKKIGQNVSNSNDLWKKLFFKNYIKGNYNDVTSIGDADYEYLALIELSKNLIFTKVIKLLRYPTEKELYNELYILHTILPHYIDLDKDIDLNFALKKIDF